MAIKDTRFGSNENYVEAGNEGENNRGQHEGEIKIRRHHWFSSLHAQGLENTALGGQPQDMGAVPQGIKEQRPRRLTLALARGPGKERRHCALITKRRHAFLRRHQRPQSRALTRNPFAHRHREAALAREGLGLWQMLGQPAPQNPFTQTLTQLQGIWQAEHSARHLAVEEGVRPSTP